MAQHTSFPLLSRDMGFSTTTVWFWGWDIPCREKRRRWIWTGFVKDENALKTRTHCWTRGQWCWWWHPTSPIHGCWHHCDTHHLHADKHYSQLISFSCRKFHWKKYVKFCSLSASRVSIIFMSNTKGWGCVFLQYVCTNTWCE